MLEGPIGTFLYLAGAAYVSRKAMQYYMRRSVWRCFMAREDDECQKLKKIGNSAHTNCNWVEFGELHPRDSQAVIYAVTIGAFWPFWVIVVGISAWVRGAPMTSAEKTRLAKEQDAKIEQQKLEIEALEGKIRDYRKET